MGIPAAFRWLSNKYPKIISPVIEDEIKTIDNKVIPVDTTRPNPNGEEFDNLYLDMNGIVHPCSHPEDKPAPKDEEEMMLEVFKYTDRVVNMVRPRKILMIAVDGVAPRAKMNQQRSRRFRTAQDSKEKEADRQELLKMLKQQNGGSSTDESAETIAKQAFDSNQITPGTPFMDTLASSLRYWCQYKLNTDPGWAKLKVIISDATVPGEGEHKIMSFVRSQRSSPSHDPNTRHVIYGLDADLIMLGLATHEPYFRVLREDVFFQEGKARTCKLCGQKGHDAANCRGQIPIQDENSGEKDKTTSRKPFIWLHVAVLREYLAAELTVNGLPFRFDLERAIDDWIFLCCFVGNDFLPHLPALELREHGIDTLTTIWRDNLASMGGYVTKDGVLDLSRAQYILDGLAVQEDAIFKRRKEQEERREANAKRRRLHNEHSRSGQTSDPATSRGYEPVVKDPAPAITHDMVMNRGGVLDLTAANKSAAGVLKERLRNTHKLPPSDKADTQTIPSALGKRKASSLEYESQSAQSNVSTTSMTQDGPVDTVRFWEDGYADRYYEQKFHKDPRDIEFRYQVARSYTEGLAWVLLYYFQGCPSWDWYYPYHYAPFAADFKNIAKMKISFNPGRISRPFEQLMSVLPAASRSALPEVFHDLMTNKDSEIIDFYPEDFEVDLNGKKMSWQGVALLPFIDMSRLLPAVQAKYPLLSPEDGARNEPGRVVLILSDNHEGLYDEILTNFFSKRQSSSKFQVNTKTSEGLSGQVEKIREDIPHGSLRYPLGRRAMPDLDYDHSVTVYYDMPTSSHMHKSMLLRGAKLPTPTLTESDIEVVKGKTRRAGRGFGGVPLTRFERNSGRREPIYFGPRVNQGRPSHNGYGANERADSYQGSRSTKPQASWHPTPPGAPGFGMGWPPPPPPPPTYYPHPRASGSEHASVYQSAWVPSPNISPEGQLNHPPPAGQRHRGPPHASRRGGRS